MTVASNRQFPWLLQAVDNNTEASHALFNPIDKKFLFLDCPNLLRGKIFKGSGFDWVVTLEDVYDRKNSNRIYLVNLLTSARIELPSRENFPDVMRYHPYRVNKEYSVFLDDEGDDEYWVFSSFKDITDNQTDKFVMSCDPSSSDGKECVVAVIYASCRHLACCTLNDKKWKPIPVESEFKCETYEDIIRSRENMDAIQGTEDMIFSKGKLHGLLRHSRKSQVLVFENINGTPPNPKITLIANHIYNSTVPITTKSKYLYIITQEYLVESSDGSCLMIVVRYIRFTAVNKHVSIPDTGYFKVYRVDPVNRTSVELKSIGDDILIVGVNTTKSISSHNCIGYKRNHVYFTDTQYAFYRKYNTQEDNEIGVFNLADRTLQSLCGFKSNPKFLWPPPIWV